MKVFFAAATVALVSGTALAQTTTVTVPGEVRTYITQQEAPSVIMTVTSLSGPSFHHLLKFTPSRATTLMVTLLSTNNASSLIHTHTGLSRLSSKQRSGERARPEVPRRGINMRPTDAVRLPQRRPLPLLVTTSATPGTDISAEV